MKKSKDSKIREGIGFNGFIVILTAITTVVTSVLGEILGNVYGKQWLGYTICDRTFYVSLSLLLVELLYEVFAMKKTISEIASTVHPSEYLVFPSENVKLEKYIEDALSHKKARKIKIICYGTNHYGGVIDQIINRFDYLNTEVILCSPDVTILDYNWDSDRLSHVIEEISKAPNITVYMSSIPPTIRASLVTTKDNLPLFCTMQPYFIYTDNKHALFRGKNIVPSIVAQDENSPILFDLADIFEKEFTRLKSSSTKYVNNNAST